MKSILKKLFTHWKTSTAALLLAIITFMFWDGDITMEQWVIGTGAIGTIIGILAKDWDKTDQP